MVTLLKGGGVRKNHYFPAISRFPIVTMDGMPIETHMQFIEWCHFQ